VHAAALQRARVHFLGGAACAFHHLPRDLTARVEVLEKLLVLERVQAPQKPS